MIEWVYCYCFKTGMMLTEGNRYGGYLKSPYATVYSSSINYLVKIFQHQCTANDPLLIKLLSIGSYIGRRDVESCYK